MLNQGLKNSIVQQIEKAINDARKRKEFLYEEIEQVEKEEEEGRKLLQTIKGQAREEKNQETQKPTKRRIIANHDNYVTAFGEAGSNGTEFEASDIWSLTGSSKEATRMKLRTMYKDQTVFEYEGKDYTLDRVRRGVYRLKEQSNAS